nr:MAG TPA: hypothetical protein [Caudoviricetes sp.]
MPVEQCTGLLAGAVAFFFILSGAIHVHHLLS